MGFEFDNALQNLTVTEIITALMCAMHNYVYIMYVYIMYVYIMNVYIMYVYIMYVVTAGVT